MDTLGYLFSILMNGQRAKLPFVNVPYSRFSLGILRVLVLEGYIAGFCIMEKNQSINYIKIILLYENGVSMIKKIKRISKPGYRVYKAKHQLLDDRGGFNCLLISTSLGILSDREALKQNIGGEILCQIE